MKGETNRTGTSIIWSMYQGNELRQYQQPHFGIDNYIYASVPETELPVTAAQFKTSNSTLYFKCTTLYKLTTFVQETVRPDTRLKKSMCFGTGIL